MHSKLLFALVGAGLAGGIASAIVYGRAHPPQPPVFTPPTNPYGRGIYANGIVESYQEHGKNTNMYPEVAGVVTEIPVEEGQKVKRGDVLIVLDDSVQAATVTQLKAQAAAASAVLEQLKAQPRKETLDVSRAQVDAAEATLARAESTRDKQMAAYRADRRAVSKQALDDSINAVTEARAARDVAKRQFELTKAGAWVYEIRNQEQQALALAGQAASAEALQRKYTLRAPRDGLVLALNTSVGSFVSTQGVYNPYTQSNDPVATLGDAGTLAVRAYVDEILVPRLGDVSKLTATMFVRGTDVAVPLAFVRVQPLVTPKIALSNDRTEKVDLRVLPIIFRFKPPAGIGVYPGQLVDVYIAPPGGGAPP
ncbi:MAG: biotin/lipoyl-binding protein [Deltaproteobacteria bacterium]|nr:biotin/lipoyl-binding protein [Deltaproteobacteria bacterium]